MDVLGIGNAIVDVLTHADDDTIRAHDLPKGGMTLINEAQAEALYAEARETRESSGGSIANSVTVAAALGASTAYVGKVADDALGSSFTSAIRAAGVHFATPALVGGPSTARCLVMVTPDGQRTMSTYLGACTALAPDDIDTDEVAGASVTLLEGYLADNAAGPEIIGKAAEGAAACGGKVALSLSDAMCVERHLDYFRELVANTVDIVISDEDEVRALLDDAPVESILSGSGGRCEIVVMTHGPNGSTVYSNGSVEKVEPRVVARVVDTTGAGDAYIGGFLHGYTRGLDLPTCGRIGSVVAAEVVTQLGAQPPDGIRELIASAVPAASGSATS